MLYNAVWPIIEFSISYSIRHCKRSIDQKKCWPNNLTNTKPETLLQFEELYNGPTFEIHYKYSAIMNIVFCTFLYGSVMPFLFPIAWL